MAQGKPDQEKRRLVSEIQASEYISISRSLLRTYVRNGMIPVVRLPHPSGVGVIHRVLYDVDDLNRFIEKWKSQKTDVDSAA